MFFDDVGWPWPKHPCTDNPQSQTSQVKQKTGNFSENVPNSFFRDREGRIKELFFLIRVEGLGESFIFILQNPVTEKIIRLQYSKSGIEKSGLRIQDFREAPSFVAEQYVFGSGELQLDFICIRLKKIIKIKMKFAVTSG